MIHLFWHQLLIVSKSLLAGVGLIILWLIIAIIGIYLFTQVGSPLNLIFGLPLLLLGLTMTLASFYEFLAGVFSWFWGKTHCPFCQEKQN